MARGRPPAHTRDQVVDAAIGIADVEGLGAVTMRRIAQEIGAGAMSLYTYVPDKDRLVDLMVDRVGGTLHPVAMTGDWRTDLLALAASQRSLMLAHPWLPAALPNRRLTGRNMLAYLEQGLAALEPTGLGGPVKLEIVALVTGLVATFVTAELAGSAPVPEQVALITEAVATGDFPQLGSVLAEGGQGGEPDFDRLAAWTITGLVTQALAANS
ncbi:TetR/AcrR family transcriptional regulator [Actinoplanes sp. Pm04-4]|uniref:TetR/AcrR family transcriptional regulator n=1 Tax=Paractinoplanes pyxinae TaxID=2997416 RepID=A0ABT4B041_9ACTN|nr:TetR/AcrR family transcriptional regulator [Actinoplanes pyxinae]MCY1139850.1 TetR/AcrR family transcriptional regulator [Actinoplanes pyxinae]